MPRLVPVHSTDRITEVIRIAILPLRYRGRTCEGCGNTLSRSRWTSWCSNGSTSRPPHSIGFGVALHLPLCPPPPAHCLHGIHPGVPPGARAIRYLPSCPLDSPFMGPLNCITPAAALNKKNTLKNKIPLPFPSYFPIWGLVVYRSAGSWAGLVARAC